MRTSSVRLGLWVLASFFVVAMAQTWPLTLHLTTHLTGRPTDDTGAYVWNTWVFRHELLAGRSPFFTSTIFALDAPTDLSLHNYTAFADVIAVPLQPILGVVGTFNLIFLLNIALAGLGMFLLARRITGRVPESWLAGFVFACSPFITARSTSHFSLVAAAPLPVFMLLLDRAWESLRTRDAVFAGLAAAWAFSCDPYYLVYCAMLAIVYVAYRCVTVTVRRAAPDGVRRYVGHGLDVAMAAIGAAILIVHVIGGGTVQAGSIQVSMRSLYTPVLVLSMLALVRLTLLLPPRVRLKTLPPIRPLVRLAVAATVGAAALLSPTLYAMARRAAEGWTVAPVLWRSSAPGVDLAAFFLPNPTHPLAPAALTASLSAQPGGFVEQVASLPLVALAVIGLAWLYAGYRPPRLWLAISLGFAALTLGPFVHVFGINTYIPTPWTLLRYVPVIGAARMPPRFAIVVMLGVAVMFAAALVALAQRYPRQRRRMLLAVSLGVAFELLGAPRPVFSAAVPEVYATIAADRRDVRVLDLPFGMIDGLGGLGDFNAATQYYQTFHQKPLLGGYLSRVSDRKKNVYESSPVMHALIVLSEGRALSQSDAEPARTAAEGFLERHGIGYVVIDRHEVTPELRQFAIDVLGLRLVQSTPSHDLYVPLSSSR